MAATGLLIGLTACDATMPSGRMQNGLHLPAPAKADVTPGPERLSRDEHGEAYTLSARTLIPIAFPRQPNIKSSFQRFKSEEARYDFFVVSRDSLTPRLKSHNTFNEAREVTTPDEQHRVRTVTRDRNHSVELSVEKRFFDTTQLGMGVGYDTTGGDPGIGNEPFVSADLRYPLWASREKLERTSEDIFRRNELNDAQLDYIKEVRSRLQDALFKFHEVVQLRTNAEQAERWRQDLVALSEKLPTAAGHDAAADARRLDAEIATVSAERRNVAGRYEIELARLKSRCGLPFFAQVELADEPFNPFAGMDHEALLKVSIDTDPEIATLRNAVRNAQVQLDLARRGRWDIALLLNGKSNLEGRGTTDGASDWSVSTGFEISAVDPRVTTSLTRQAQANIARFNQAIAARENDIFSDTLESLVRLQTIGESRDQLMASLPKYEADYRTGVEEYLAGRMNIDDLLKRRENLGDQIEVIAEDTFLLGANVAELCSATGKFFELLNGAPAGP